MISKIDNWLINQLDKATTKLQKKGALLTSIHVNVMGLTLLIQISLNWIHYSPASIILSGGLWGSWLWVYVAWANANKDYPTSARIMERLNAKVIALREKEFLTRLTWLFLIPVCYLGSVIAPTQKDTTLIIILNLLSPLTPTLSWYLNCCQFLGPGHFAKETKQAVNRQAAYMDV